MTSNNQHVTSWNQFAGELYLYHRYLTSTHDIRTEKKGGYVGLPNFYREVSYYESGNLRRDKLI